MKEHADGNVGRAKSNWDQQGTEDLGNYIAHVNLTYRALCKHQYNTHSSWESLEYSSDQTIWLATKHFGQLKEIEVIEYIFMILIEWKIYRHVEIKQHSLKQSVSQSRWHKGNWKISWGNENKYKLNSLWFNKSVIKRINHRSNGSHYVEGLVIFPGIRFYTWSFVFMLCVCYLNWFFCLFVCLSL